MTETCVNCGADITDGGIIKAPNRRFESKTVEIINFLKSADYSELCEKCGRQIVDGAFAQVNNDIATLSEYTTDRVSDFPMMTLGLLPTNANYKIKTMLTANVAVGTGIFNELSQGLSDIFGAVNTDTGMAYKVNSGEAAARSILVHKAVSIGANAIIAVDIDYGTTGNNAATVNMQGTAVYIENLSDILDGPELEAATKLHRTYARIRTMRGWLKGDLQRAN